MSWLIIHLTLQAEPQKVYINLKESRVFPFTFRHPLLRTIAIFSAMANLGITAGSSILLLFAQEILGLDDLGFGLPITGLAAGGLVGSLDATLLGARSRVGLVVLGGIAVAGLSQPAVELTTEPVTAWILSAAGPEGVAPIHRLQAAAQ